MICASFLLWVAASVRRERRLALAVFSAFAVIDLLAANSDVNPTTDPSLLKEPAWVNVLPRDMHERVYIGGRLEGYVNTGDDDAPRYARDLDGYTQQEQRYIVVTEFMFQPSALITVR